jgi:cholest-4-en-3-one 26-monooxygenase
MREAPPAERRVEAADPIDLAPYMGSGTDEVHAAFRELRAKAPLARQPSLGFWAVTKHADVLAVERDTHLFSSEAPLPSVFGEMILKMDPPRHTRLRGVINRGFTPGMIKRLEPNVRELTTEIIDAAARQGECDFVQDVAAKVPLAVFGEMLGVPKEDHDRVLAWADALSEAEASPESLARPPEASHSATQLAAATDMFDYVMGPLRKARQNEPQDDLVTVLLQADVEGEKLSDAEFFGFFPLLIVAGNETTRHAAAGGMLELMRHPEQRALLTEDPSRIPAAVEEILRWTSPVGFFDRFVTADTELRGQAIKEGETLKLFYPSANRDEEVFPEPDVFNLQRDPNPHIAFGFGAHFCLGASLARLEIRVILEEWLSRFPHSDLSGDLEYTRSAFLRGLTRMPVRLKVDGMSAAGAR